MNNKLKIEKKIISEKSKPYIVAELSANHNGSVDNALKHIKSAKKNGADAIKIQTYTPDSITMKSNRKDFLIKKGIWKNKTLYDLYKWAHTPYEWHKKIFDYANKNQITCFSTPFDESGVDLLEKLNTPAYKIASFELIDIPLIKYAAKTKKPMIMSTGMASVKEIDDAVNVVEKHNSIKRLILLHCVSGYPTNIELMNLKKISFLRNRYKCLVGLSDHSKGMIAPIVSVSYGACLIEKHFITSKKIKSPDKDFSILPKELSELCQISQKTFLAKGDGSVKNNLAEKESIKYRRSIYVINNIKKNEKLTSKNIKRIRPGYGLPPKFYEKLLGKKASKNLFAGKPLQKDDYK